MEWLKELTTLLGVNPLAFMAVTALILLVIAVFRYVIGKEQLEKKRWWKAILTGGALVLGIGAAMLARAAGIYTSDNIALNVLIGLFNGSLAVASHQFLKQIPWLDKWLNGVNSASGTVGILLAAILFSGCGGWLNDTRAGILSANAALNTYDDVAIEIWDNSPSHQESREQLGVSLCATYIIQDALIEAWTIASAVDAGIEKKKDFNEWIGYIITILDALEDHLEMAGVEMPHQLSILITYLESMNPKGILPFTSEPLAECHDLLSERHPMAAGSTLAVMLRAAAELGIFIVNLLADRVADKDIPEEALAESIRPMLHQAVLYDMVDETEDDDG